MTQTKKGQDSPALTRPSGNRPGQRQQERLQRLARRRRRRQRITSVIVAIIFLVVASLGIWQFKNYQDRTASQHDAETATAAVHTTATANVHASATAKVEAPDTPPQVNAQPVTLSDGLQYIDIQEGTGSPAANGSTLSVTYTGWLQSNGQKFDSSYDHGGQPFSVTLGQGQVIKGWDEGLVGVKAGGKRRLIIPGALGYGAQGSGPIPPDATLIFDIKVISIQ